MSLGENISNAIEVLDKTYENLDKFMSFARQMAERETSYVNVGKNFPRYRYDTQPDSWLVRELTLTFQHKSDRKLKNGWRDGPVYALAIILDVPDGPRVALCKYTFHNIASFPSSATTSAAGVFGNAALLTDESETGVEIQQEGDIIRVDILDKAISEEYSGLKSLDITTANLVNIKADNMKARVFDVFDTLRGLKARGLVSTLGLQSKRIFGKDN